MLEATHVRHRHDSAGLTPDLPIIRTDWEIYIHQLAVDISKEQSPQRLMAAREKLYELLVHCIPPATILKTLVRELLVNLDDMLKQEVLEWLRVVPKKYFIWKHLSANIWQSTKGILQICLANDIPPKTT
jgi:hypothetical protein